MFHFLHAKSRIVRRIHHRRQTCVPCICRGPVTAAQRAALGLTLPVRPCAWRSVTAAQRAALGRIVADSIIQDGPENRKAAGGACAALGIEALTDVFPQADEFELRPFSPIWAYQKPQELQDMETVLNDIAQIKLVKCVMCSEADFDATWDAFQKELADNGLEECQKGYTEWLATKIM